MYAEDMGLKEIAEKAGVSKTTVSLALNGQKGVGKETRERILALAREMHYQVPGERGSGKPNRGTILFVRFKKHGLLLNQDQSKFIMDYIDSINCTVCEAGYTFEIFDCRCNSMEKCIDEIKGRSPQGAVILGTEMDRQEFASLDSLPVPFVVIDTYFDDVRCDFVDMENAGTVHQVVRYLEETGHRSIGMASCSVKSGNILMRERGFRLAMERSGLEADPLFSLALQPGFSGAYESMIRYLDSGRKLPEALFCYNDIAAYGTIKALKSRGLTIPGDISLVGYDDLPSSSMMDPPLTSIKIPNHQIGRKAVQLLLEKIESSPRDAEPTSILVGGSLVIRNSVKDRT
jgi:LacI family transcriptional regulator